MVAVCGCLVVLDKGRFELHIKPTVRRNQTVDRPTPATSLVVTVRLVGFHRPPR
jgi:hypothetical protein